MKVQRDEPAVFDMAHQKERRFSPGTKVGPSAVLFRGVNQKERRSSSGKKAGPAAILFIGDKQEERGFASRIQRLLNLQEKNLWFLAGQVVLIAAVIIGWRIVSELGSGAPHKKMSGVAKTGQSDAASRWVIEAQEKPVAGLIERRAILADSINHRESLPIANAEQGLTSSIARKETASAKPEQIIDTPPPAAAGQKAGNANLAQLPNPRTNSAADAQSGADNVMPTVAGIAPFRADHAPVARKRPAGSMGTGGPWVINLASSTRKADADRFERKARSVNIKTEQQLVTIKGHQYWRVQITGFATTKEARTKADEVQEKLGLKDVWILKRQ